MRDFETEYQRWMNTHMSKRKGERLRMLKEQHGFLEKLMVKEIWWPVAGNFDFLHPEYEVVDEDGNYYYLDLAYMRYPKPTNLESDGFTTHAREADRKSFRKSRRRQNAIALEGWNILRFSADDIKDDLEYCRKTLKRMLERWYEEENADWSSLPLPKREIMRLVTRSSRPIRAMEAAAALGTGMTKTRKMLHQMVDEGWLEPVGSKKRTHYFRAANRKNGKSR